MYIFLGVSVALASFLVLSISMSLLASGIGTFAIDLRDRVSPRTFSQITFALRVWPIAFSVIIVLGLIVPSFVLFEPQTSSETVTIKLGLIALVSAFAIAVAVYRILNAFAATRRLTTTWNRSSEPIMIRGFQQPIYKFDHNFPVMAVIGIVRPRIFVARRVLETLTPAELSAALEHERGHILSRDNLKRVVMDFCRSVILFPIASFLPDAWSEASEQVADQSAVNSDPSRAADLASALIRIARMTNGPLEKMPLAASVAVADGENGVAERVARLLRIDDQPREGILFKFPSSAFALTSALAVILGINFLGQSILLSTHEIMEVVVQILQ